MTAPGGALPEGFRLGFVGTGNLGSKVVVNLLRHGVAVTVHDARPEAASDCLAAGASWADTPAEAAAGSAAVVTCLPRVDVVAEVLEADGGILAGLSPGSCWIDMTTNDKGLLLRLSERAAARGVATLEAPVTGGVHRAASGELTVLVGGSHDVYLSHLPLLELIGSKVIYLGPIGRASAMKVVTNMLAFIHLVAAGEALMLAARAGVDLGAAYESIRSSSGNSFVHETESQLILSGSYDIGFTVDLALKDLGLVHALADETGVPAGLAFAVEERFRLAKERYGGDAFSPRVVQLLEDEMGTALRAPGFPESLLDDAAAGPADEAGGGRPQ